MESLEDRRLLAIVNFDPGAYSGDYQVAGQGFVNGLSSNDLAAGTYHIGVADSGGFFFDVDGVGNVTSNNAAAATGAGNTLTFNTTTINVDPGAYSGPSQQYRIHFGSSFASGLQSLVVVPNINNYRMLVADSAGFFFDVDAAGNVASANAAAASGAGNTLTFNTTTINVDPGAYSGPSQQYRIHFGSSFASGLQSIVVVPNVNNYRMLVADSNGFFFDVDAVGDVTSDNAQAATGVGDTLTFNTTTINIDPGAFSGPSQQYRIHFGSALDTGPQSLTVIPNIDNYRMQVADSDGFRFDVDAAGNVTTTNGAAASGAGNTLIFNTTTVFVDPGGFPNSYFLHLGSGLVTGPQSFVLVPNVTNYRIFYDSPNDFRFDVDASGQPTPSSVDVTFGGTDYTFLLSGGCSLTVTHTGDGGPGSLREAVICANSTPGADTINLGPGTYVLSIAGAGEDAAATGDLDITDDLTITGDGAATTVIDGGGIDRVFHIPTSATVDITGVTIQSGSVAGEGGGVFLNAGILQLTDSTVSGNSASNTGGAFYSFIGTLSVTNSTVSGNSAGNDGGGFQNDSGTLSVTNSTVSGNTASLRGGGFNNYGTLGVTNSSVSGNSSGDLGGGFFNEGALSVTNSTVTGNTAGLVGGGFLNGLYSNSTLSVTNSTVTGNTADTGGGFHNYYGTLSVTNTTVTGNTADIGGGFYNSFDSYGMSVTSSTISGNSASSVGGGIANYNDQPITSDNTIVAANSDASGTPDILGPLSGDHNLIGDGTGGTVTGANNQIGTSASPIDPLLGPLQNNGGPTDTHELLTGSPAIDAGSAFGLVTDQRGEPRTIDVPGVNDPPVGDSTDIGAFEVNVALNQPPVAVDDVAGEVTISEDDGPGPVDVTADMLANDFDPDFDPLMVVAIDDSSITAGVVDLTNGVVTFDPNGQFESLGIGQSAIQTFTYTIDDGNGGQDSATVDVVITGVNDDPAVTANTDPVSVSEGGLASNSGSFSDIDNPDSVTITASVGTITFQDPGNNGNWSWEFNTTDGPAESQLVTITADDGNGGVVTTEFQLTVNNVPPTIASVIVPVAPIDINDQSSFIVDVNFSDPAGAADEPFTCNFDMDDDGFNDITVPGVTGTSCSTSLEYSEPGVYTVTATVTDKDGGVSDEFTVTEFIVIYDPSGGFVTGGGWIDSPEGAYVPDPTLIGRANFGFVSKYKKGATIPTGPTEFQFSAGDLNFHSGSYDWLVITNHKAMYKGDGTINGQGDYGFQLTAIDAALTPSTDVDLFRMRIWNNAGGGLVYDNKVGESDPNADPTTAIGGGNIKIHKAKASAAAAILPGDANFDGLVNFGDSLILADNFGRLDASFDQGDFDGDGQVQFGDFLILSDRFTGQSLAPFTSDATSHEAEAIESVFDADEQEPDWWLELEGD